VLAQASAELGERDRAVGLAREAASLYEERGQQLSYGPLSLARVLMCVDGPEASDEVRSLLGQARDWIERHGQHGNGPELLELEAQLERLLENPEGCRRRLLAARDAALEIGAAPRAARLEAELARLG
jgi:hypothetical protein